MVKLLHDYLVEQAQRSSEADALVMGQERLSYGQLDADSNRVARALLEGGCQRGDRIVILLPKSPQAIVAILGALKAGCAYVPVDVSYPLPRTLMMVTQCAPKAFLSASPQAALIDGLLNEAEVEGRPILGWMDSGEGTGGRPVLQFNRDDLQGFPDAPVACPSAPEDPAYIMFTSGSTGLPKGVVNTHANVTCFVQWATRYFEMGSGDRLSGHSPLHFDLSVFDVFGALAAGAELHLVPPEISVLPHKVAGFIRTSRLTQWFSVPSVLTYMAKFDVVNANDFPELKRLMWCGEVLPTPVLRHFMQCLPDVSFTNLYGPTETTIASSYYRVPGCPEDDQAEIPLGRACPGEELLVLDDDLQPVPAGEQGDLYIGGVGVGAGYWKDPERTREVFIPDPRPGYSNGTIYRTGDLARLGTDGQIYFRGRADTQVKVRGYRVELGDVEMAMNALTALRECAVVASTGCDEFGSSDICAVWVPMEDREVTPAALRGELSKVLPNYMLPSRWMAMDGLPRNQNGKVDRARLKQMFP